MDERHILPKIRVWGDECYLVGTCWGCYVSAFRQYFPLLRFYSGQRLVFCSEKCKNHIVKDWNMESKVNLQTELIGKIARDLHLYDINYLPEDIKFSILHLAFWGLSNRRVEIGTEV